MTESCERIQAELGRIEEETPTTLGCLAVDLGWGSKTLVAGVRLCGGILQVFTFVGLSFQIMVLV